MIWYVIYMVWVIGNYAVTRWLLRDLEWTVRDRTHLILASLLGPFGTAIILCSFLFAWIEEWDGWNRPARW